MTQTIAFLISSNVCPGHPDAGHYALEFTREFEALEGPCKEAGFILKAVVWDDPALNPDEYAAMIVGPTWDYPLKQDLFLETLARFERHCPVFNPAKLVRWNLDKYYLQDLAERGVKTVPTLWADHADEATISAAFNTLGSDTLVVKPRVGAGAWRQAKIKRGEALPAPEALPPAQCMIQPFLPAIATEGEYTYLYFGGEFSHALVKRPKAGDYRVQGEHGGQEEKIEPSTDDLAVAKKALDAACTHLGLSSILYARVDLARGLDGELALMELEMIEPYLYPLEGPGMGVIFARALARLLDEALTNA
ncbi:ATP-grasp domain-containing protein [Woodsholea maritima]|uniref:ATP-grasp domain-containing protein n=1 Tax=Woodsholea maritima TaxID=240237 RepID=UPI00035E3568|nr:hypothetical protein [Woodsholea maritima]